MAAAKDEQAPIIIKKIKKGKHAHHGGAWKIAYADFVTAMMAFFLLLWLLNVTTTEQKAGIADYFAPRAASLSESGAAGVMGGQSLDNEGAQTSGSVVLNIPESPQTPEIQRDGGNDETAPDGAERDPGEAEIASFIAEREEKMFEAAEQELREAIDSTPDLADLDNHIIIDRTPDGMRIQIVDQENRSMFPSGSAEMFPFAQQILSKVGKVIMKLPNRIAISGHTDARAFRGRDGYSNWELSAERANASRRVLMNSGVANPRVSEVTGKAATEPLFPEDPYLSPNRRISIILLREAPVLPPSYR